VERAGGDTQWGNLFTYAANNPVTFVDANGMDFLGDVWGGIVGGAGWIWDNIIFGIPNEIISSINWYAHATDAERAGFWAGVFAGIVVGVTILLIAASCLVGCEGLLLLAPLAAFIAGTAAAGVASIAVTKALGGQPTAAGTMHAMFWGGFIAGAVAGAGSAKASARAAMSKAPRAVGAAGPKAPAAAVVDLNIGDLPIPQVSKDRIRFVLDNIKSTGKAPEGYEGGRPFRNDKGYLDPEVAGYYNEDDIHPRRPGLNRGPERLVVRGDLNKGGKAWYTDTHYGDRGMPAFYKLEDP
jgi:guanyl-specific ribonuclease Sa